MLRWGLVADESEANPWLKEVLATRSKAALDEELEALRAFNDRAAAEERVETFLMPLFDGLGMVRLLD
jgi:hypothetical protein